MSSACLRGAAAGAAELFRDADSRHAEIDETLPDLLGVSLVAIEHAAHDFRRALVSQEFANLLLEQLLVVGEIEVHDGRSLASPSGPGNGCRFRLAGSVMC